MQYIALLLLVATLAGCRSDVERAMERAESLMESHPDSALSVLLAVEPPLDDDLLRARHASLVIDAMERTGNTAKVDSFAWIAEECYERANTPYYDRLADFYRSRAQIDNQEYGEALSAILASERMRRNLEHQVKMNRRMRMYGNCAIGLLVLVALLIYWHLRRRRKLRHSALALADELEAVRRDLALARQNDMRSRVDELFVEQFSWVEHIVELYMMAESQPDKTHAASKMLNRELSKLKTERFVAELADIINRDTDGRLTRIFERVPDLVESERRLLTYLCAGLSARVIATLTGQSIGSVYSRKYRTLKKVRAICPELVEGIK